MLTMNHTTYTKNEATNNETVFTSSLYKLELQYTINNAINVSRRREDAEQYVTYRCLPAYKYGTV